jgi:hypothetical protein
MVVLALLAQAIAELTGPVAQGVDDPVLRQGGQGPVHGCEADPGPAGAQALVELLGRHVVSLA